MNDVRRFITFIALLFLCIVLQVRSVEWLGWHVDTVLPVLIIAACWVSVFYEALLALTAVLLMNRRPGFAPELIVLAALPVLIAILGPHLPWRRTVSILAGTALGLATIYAITGGLHAFAWHGFFWKDVLVSTIFALVLSRIPRSLYGLRGAGVRGRIYDIPR